MSAEPSAAGPCLRIMVVDDHALFRHGVSEALSDEADMQVVAQASSGEEALELVRLLRPQGLDLVLMDIDMPGIGGVEATRHILAENPQLPVVMLTGSALDRDLFAALEAGAIGFLTKNLVPQAIGRALRDYSRQGALPMPRNLATKALMHLQRTTRLGRQEATPPPAEVERLVSLALASAGVEDGHVAVEFVGAARIAELNEGHRGVEGPTDVLSFPIDGSDAAAGPRELGDIVICPRHTEDLREAIVHGALHLTGMDHETDDGEMLALQAELLTW
jgi:probable rRNA maturation factor